VSAAISSPSDVASDPNGGLAVADSGNNRVRQVTNIDTVAYDGNGATSGTAPTDVLSPYHSGDTVTVLDNTGSLVNTGFTFGGWSTAPGAGTRYAPGDTFTILTNTTLYAVWTPNTALAQKINFKKVSSKTLAQSPVTVSATATSGLTVTFTTTTPSVCTSGGTNGATITLLAVGTCTVQAQQAGNATYSAAPTVSQSFAVLKNSQKISFGKLANKTLAQSPVTVSATASSGLTVTFTTTTPSVCTSGGTNGATITLLAVGTCTVQAHQAGDATYNAAPTVSQSFKVSRQ